MLIVAAPFDMLKSIMTPFSDPGYEGPRPFLVLLANFFILVAAGLSVAALAFGFVLYATSSGDIKNTEKAQRAVLWGAIGIAISLAAFALEYVLTNATGVTGLFL
jgi:hypothetical protein